MSKINNSDYFNFGNADKIAYKNKIKIKQVLDDLPDFEKINKDIEKKGIKINKKNKNYYDLYKDFNETVSKKDIVHKLENAPFLFWNEHPQKYYQRYNNTKQCENAQCEDADTAELVREAYFLQENIEIIQRAIIKKVAKKTNYIISRQKDDDIILLMNGIYHDYAKNLPYDLKEQLLELNDRTVNFVVPHIISEAEAYQRYLVDSNTPLQPPELPENVGKPRQQSLPSTFPR